MEDNTPAFVLELEIDDEISLKPLKKKRCTPLSALFIRNELKTNCQVVVEFCKHWTQIRCQLNPQKEKK